MENIHSPDNLVFQEMFSRQKLRSTWRSIRKEARRLEIRDILDWIDWSLAIDTSLDNLRNEILEGCYEPCPPTRYEVGKSKGSYRVLTALNIKDALVYRHISDYAFEKALPLKIQGAYFSRRHSASPVGKTFSLRGDGYYSMFEVWLRYNEYRSRTLLNEIFHVLVVADISNFFDSISHSILLEYISPLDLPRKAIGLLGRLLEAFKPLTGHSPNPRIGLPVDELDCSRQLAHIFLFEHDHRIAQEFGEENYVRWMDDQNIGARDVSQAKKIVNLLTRSLSTQRLTLNDGKTKFLTPEEVVLHFQLDANESLNQLEERHNNFHRFSVEDARGDFEATWAAINEGESVGKGNWNKVLKRVYGIATKLDCPLLEQRALEDLIDFPWLTQRIFTYFARRNQAELLFDLFQSYYEGGHNLFESTEACFFEAALLLEPSEDEVARYQRLAIAVAQGEFQGQSTRPLGRATATLLQPFLIR